MRLFAILLLLVCLRCVYASDPAQPKVGPTPVINATNGYGGILTVRTQVNVGYVGQTGVLTISPVDTNQVSTLTVDTNGTFVVSPIPTDTFDVPAVQVHTPAIGEGNMMDWVNDTTLVASLEGDGTLFATRLFAISDGIPSGDFFTRIQSTDMRINAGVATNRIDLSALDHSILIYNGGVLDFGLQVDAADGTTPYLLGTSVTHTTGNLAEFRNNGAQAIFVGPSGELNWTPTNSLYHSGTDLIYTNGVDQPSFKVENGTADYASIGLGSGGNASIGTSGNTIYMDKSVVTRALTPFQPGYVLGQLGNAWTQFHGLVSYISPSFNNGGTNYAYLKTSLASTNGPIELLSAANGTAGTPKAINISFGTDISSATNYVQFDANETSNETGILVRRNGSVVRVTIGASDSGGSGFRVLRVPN